MRIVPSGKVCLTLLASSFLWIACGGGSDGSLPGVGKGGAGNPSAGGSTSSTVVFPVAGDGSTVLPPPATGTCGNGILDANEACDDGNQVSNDGCVDSCRRLERGFSCAVPGKPCHAIARCGDGFVAYPELCDDGNTTDGDGCAKNCKFELGYKCAGNPSVCSPTVCGDGLVEGAESCEDGNNLPFDGCSAFCQSEPNCTAGACTSKCGDGIALNEECDDGNQVSGDGCSEDCKMEAGYECVPPKLGNTMLVPIVYRDFLAAHEDFEPGVTGQEEAVTGLVANELDAEGKPVAITPAGSKWISSPTTFQQWYRDVEGVNAKKVGTLTLYGREDGSYVNHMGPNGEYYQKTSLIHYCGTTEVARKDADGNPIPCTTTNAPGVTECEEVPPEKFLRCFENPNSAGTYMGEVLDENLEGNPLFFPVDDVPFTPDAERAPGVIAMPYANWVTEESKYGVATKHNFHFTSEVRYWFQFDATKSYTLDFSGDDDVWVFINKKLAVDLGGIHTAVSGSVTLDATTAATFGLVDGQVYEVALFQAERQKTASTYKLTLSGFSAGASDCRPKCGDAVLGLGEECDDGINDGGYGECAAGCVLGEFCGDGIKQGPEECDDGNNDDGDLCGSACRNIVLL